MNLKPCPFCGHKASLVTYSGGGDWCASIECSNVKNCTATVGPFNSDKKATEAWNRRQEAVK